ncbi:MAG: RNB domain-containing ribonuclease [Rhodocyclaceae bacterium]|nr:RNB domain-containing ribonuclease [Rhodocyclaceae bacterium]
MNVLYEEDGALKAAAVLAEQNTSLHIETPHGKRAKIKASHVLMRFAAPAAGDLLAGAAQEAEQIPLDFLWEASGEAEFGFDELAGEYFGASATPLQQAAVALRMHGAPMYFYRKGRGRYKAAPADALKAALAGQARRAAQAAQLALWEAQLVEGELPDALRPALRALLHKPDRSSLEWKAVDAAAARLGVSPTRLLANCGAIPSTACFHRERFLAEHFPHGIGFAVGPVQASPPLPLAEGRAFSIDDAATTEIDDAFSVQHDAGHVRVGIHIAAPALGIPRGSDVDAAARARMSTVYLPGDKITMLPGDWVDTFSLLEGRVVPVVSLYLWCDAATLAVERVETRVESIRITANLRHDTLDPLFNAETLVSGLGDFEWRDELLTLHRLAQRLEQARGRLADMQPDKVDYSFVIERGDGGPDSARVRIVPRKRGSPIDLVVSELMIFANSTWGRALDDAGLAGIYRSQQFGKTRMGTQASPHQGLGVSHYAWSSSPIRRYADLVNQRQIVALARDEDAPYGSRDDDLFAIVRDFELAYDAYAEFQRHMERYWCLRFLLQEDLREVDATLIRDDLVRVSGLPLVMRARGLPLADPGTPLRLVVDDIDLLDVSCRLTPAPR